MADQNGESPRKSFEERLDAIAMTLELMMRDREDERIRDEARWAEADKRWAEADKQKAEADREHAAWDAEWRQKADVFTFGIQSLLKVVEAHENRIVKLERRA